MLQWLWTGDEILCLEICAANEIILILKSEIIACLCNLIHCVSLDVDWSCLTCVNWSYTCLIQTWLISAKVTKLKVRSDILCTLPEDECVISLGCGVNSDECGIPYDAMTLIEDNELSCCVRPKTISL